MTKIVKFPTNSTDKFIVIARTELSRELYSELYHSAIALVEDLRTGQIKHPEEVWELGRSVPITEDVARALAQRLRDRMESPTESQREFIEQACGIGTVMDAVAFEMSRV